MELMKFNEGQIPSKAEIKEAAKQIETMYTEGGLALNPVRDYVALKAVETFVKDALKTVSPWAVQAAANYSDSERKNLYGAQVIIKAGAVEYDYSGAPGIDELEAKAAAAKEEYDRAAAALKSAQEDAVKMQMAVVTDRKPDSLVIKF